MSDTRTQKFMTEFLLEYAAFKKKLPELRKKYPGEWVAILDRAVVDHSPIWEPLAEKMQKEHPTRFVFIEQVTPSRRRSRARIEGERAIETIDARA